MSLKVSPAAQRDAHRTHHEQHLQPAEPPAATSVRDKEQVSLTSYSQGTCRRPSDTLTVVSIHTSVSSDGSSTPTQASFLSADALTPVRLSPHVDDAACQPSVYFSADPRPWSKLELTDQGQHQDARPQAKLKSSPSGLFGQLPVTLPRNKSSDHVGHEMQEKALTGEDLFTFPTPPKRTSSRTVAHAKEILTPEEFAVWKAKRVIFDLPERLAMHKKDLSRPSDNSSAVPGRLHGADKPVCSQAKYDRLQPLSSGQKIFTDEGSKNYGRLLPRETTSQPSRVSQEQQVAGWAPMTSTGSSHRSIPPTTVANLDRATSASSVSSSSSRFKHGSCGGSTTTLSSPPTSRQPTPSSFDQESTFHRVSHRDPLLRPIFSVDSRNEYLVSGPVQRNLDRAKADPFSVENLTALIDKRVVSLQNKERNNVHASFEVDEPQHDYGNCQVRVRNSQNTLLTYRLKDIKKIARGFSSSWHLDPITQHPLADIPVRKDQLDWLVAWCRYGDKTTEPTDIQDKNIKIELEFVRTLTRIVRAEYEDQAEQGLKHQGFEYENKDALEALKEQEAWLLENIFDTELNKPNYSELSQNIALALRDSATHKLKHIRADQPLSFKSTFTAPHGTTILYGTSFELTYATQEQDEWLKQAERGFQAVAKWLRAGGLGQPNLKVAVAKLGHTTITVQIHSLGPAPQKNLAATLVRSNSRLTR